MNVTCTLDTKQQSAVPGEGGAGTWSDGKLTTKVGRNSDPVRRVLQTLHHFGAPEVSFHNSNPAVHPLGDCYSAICDAAAVHILAVPQCILYHCYTASFGSNCIVWHCYTAPFSAAAVHPLALLHCILSH